MPPSAGKNKDGIQLYGLKAKAPNPTDWEVVGDFFSEEPYGMAMRKGEPKFKQVVDAGLKQGFESGKYFEIYDKWFGPKGELPYPMSPQVKAYLLKQKRLEGGGLIGELPQLRRRH